MASGIHPAGAGTIRTSAGNDLFVSQSDAREGLPVLFLNSLAADLTMWDGVRERLRRRSVAFDARGHGRSGIVPGDADLRDLAADALAVMDATGIRRAVLCGLSLGGLAAMQVAALAPARVAGLVLANTAVNFPPPSMWSERADKARAGQFPDLVEPTLERWLTPQFRAASPEATAAVRAMIAATPAEGYAAACAALKTGDTTDALKAFAGPVLAIAGRHDPSTPVARAEEIVSLAKDGRMVILEAAHLSSTERPVEFAAALEEFISDSAS